MVFLFFISHICTIPAAVPAARYCPSGEKVRDVSGAVAVCGERDVVSFPVVILYILMVLLFPPQASLSAMSVMAIQLISCGGGCNEVRAIIDVFCVFHI